MGTDWYEPAPAKINLALHIVGQCSNGYHELESLCVFTELCDELSAQEASEDEVVLAGPFGAALRGERLNIVLKALTLFRDQFPGKLPKGLKIELDKALPVAAGIGGGSADAAAMLRLANRISGLHLDLNDLMKMALKLGADVPMCLLSRTAFVKGIGEKKSRPLLNSQVFNWYWPIQVKLFRQPKFFANCERRITHRSSEMPPILPISQR